MTLQYKVGRAYSNSRKEIMLHDTEVLASEAAFACELMKQLGIVACKLAGEDSSGRQKMELLTPEEVVDRATNIAKYAFKKFRETDLITNLPDVSEVWPEAEDKD